MDSGDIEGGEDVDCKDNEEGDEIISNCDSDDREYMACF